MIASYIIFTCYGFWLPNDPRGSGSDYVRNKRLLRFGDAKKAEGAESLAYTGHDHRFRVEAKTSLEHAPVILSGTQARAVGRGISMAVEESQYVVLACCIMPNHVHAIVLDHENPPKRIIGHFKARATHRLKEEKLLSKETPSSPWARKGWSVFLDKEEAVFQAIQYVERNPIRDGLPPQTWSFIAKNDN